MSLIVNGVTIPSNGEIIYNGTKLTKVICNGVTVWEKYTGPITYSDPTAFPNRNGGATGAMASGNKNTLSYGAHSNDEVDGSCWLTTGSFSLPSGAKTLTLNLKISMWGERDSARWICTCGSNTQTVDKGGNSSSLSFSFDVSGLSTTSVTCSMNCGTSRSEFWFGISFVSIVIGF